MRQDLVKELKYVLDQMRSTQNPVDKLYYFTAVYGIANRIFNFEYDPELVFVHDVVQHTYNSINQRLNLIAQRLEGGASMPGDVFAKLEACLEKLADKIENDQKTYEVLQEMDQIAYSTSGNGYYLYKKGTLKI
jgi:hypothetical protein